MVVLPKNFNATKVNLSGLGLTEIPKEVFKYKNLRKLFLHNNAITKIPTEIKQLKLLNTLDISDNRITTLYASIFELKSLNVLLINNNKIKNIPSQISNLRKLRILGIANNQLASLNPNFKYLQELKELNLSGNKFNVFPDQIYLLGNLNRLWIKQKGLYVIGEETLKLIIPIKRVYQLQKEKNKTELSEKHETSKQIELNKQNTKTLQDLKNGNVISPEEYQNKIILKQIKKKIFISYSHQDKEEWLERVKKHIKVLTNYSELDFEVWDDKRINAGDNWKEEIQNALRESTAAILLISTDYLASDFIKNNELQPLLDMAKEKGTRILPLILSPCRFLKIKSLSKFQAINNPENEILSKLKRPEQDEILEKLTDEVEKHIN